MNSSFTGGIRSDVKGLYILFYKRYMTNLVTTMTKVSVLIGNLLCTAIVQIKHARFVS